MRDTPEVCRNKATSSALGGWPMCACRPSVLSRSPCAFGERTICNPPGTAHEAEDKQFLLWCRHDMEPCDNPECPHWSA